MMLFPFILIVGGLFLVSNDMGIIRWYQLRSERNQIQINIDRLKQEIANLQTLVEIELLKSELSNLKILALKGNTRKTKKN